MLKIRQWTEAQRVAQALRIRIQRPWMYSTGPKTAEGKAKSSRNAWKHGARSAETKIVHSYFAASRLLLRLVRERKRIFRATRLQGGYAVESRNRLTV